MIIKCIECGHDFEHFTPHYGSHKTNKKKLCSKSCSTKRSNRLKKEA